MRHQVIVVDASTLVAAVVDTGPLGGEARQYLHGRRRVAPHLIDAETGQALRRHALREELAPSAAEAARRNAETWIDRRYPHHGALAVSAWTMRDRVSFYDALYLALAESIDCPLVTADQRLGHSIPGHHLIRTIPIGHEVDVETLH